MKQTNGTIDRIPSIIYAIVMKSKKTIKKGTVLPKKQPVNIILVCTGEASHVLKYPTSILSNEDRAKIKQVAIDLMQYMGSTLPGTKIDEFFCSSQLLHIDSSTVFLRSLFDQYKTSLPVLVPKQWLNDKDFRTLYDLDKEHAEEAEALKKLSYIPQYEQPIVKEYNCETNENMYYRAKALYDYATKQQQGKTIVAHSSPGFLMNLQAVIEGKSHEDLIHTLNETPEYLEQRFLKPGEFRIMNTGTKAEVLSQTAIEEVAVEK